MQQSLAPHSETRSELTGLLTGKLGDIPEEIVVDHLMSIYGETSWVLLREAAHAVRRRFKSVGSEELRVATRPSKREVFGLYRTRRAGQRVRPYTTLLSSLRPLVTSCDCPDYLKGGLGVCKHGLAILASIAAQPRSLAKAEAQTNTKQAPAASWNPIRAFSGPAEWFEGVRLRVRSLSTLPKGLRDAFAPAGDDMFSPDPKHLRTDEKRRRFVDALDRFCGKQVTSDPALSALLVGEREELDRRAQLRMTPAQLRSALRTLTLDLYPYQRRAVDKFLATGRLLLADDMGLGKTVQATAIAHVLAGTKKVERILVLAPASLKSQWVREWRRATEVSIEKVEGTPDARAEAYANTRQGALVANYEQLRRDLSLVQNWQPQLVILDEAQRIKNWATQTAQLVKQIDAPYRLVLTGTPLENRLDELVSIMDWVDPWVLSPKWRLSATHDVRNDGSREVVGVRDLDVLRTRLEPRLMRRRRSEILTDLPGRTDTRISVDITPEQASAHADLDQPIARLLSAARTRPLTHAQFLRLMVLLTTQRIIANGMAQLNFAEEWPGLAHRRPHAKTFAALSSPKLEHLRTLIESLVIDQGRKVVVFSQWRRMLMLANWSVADLLEGHGKRAAFFTGQESQRRRTENVVNFHDDPSVSVLFCTDAGGVGLNLQRAANACICLELPWNPAVLEQRIARIHRLGQPDPIDVFTLVTEESIEGRISITLATKQALFTGVFDGESNEVDFEGATSFVSQVTRIMDAKLVAAAGGDAGGDAIDGVDDVDGEHDFDDDNTEADPKTPARESEVDEVVRAGDEQRDAPDMREPAPIMLPRADEVARLLADIRIEPRADGGVHIEAPPQAAATLGAVFAGMAKLLEEANR